MSLWRIPSAEGADARRQSAEKPDAGKNSIRVSPYGWKNLGVINLIRDP